MNKNIKKVIKLKTIIIILLILSSVGLVYYQNNYNQGQNIDEFSEKYQGPIQEGYDEEHFRETGISILIEDNQEKTIKPRK